MSYRRVLYTSKLTEQLKSKLRIIACHKRPACKGNVYFVCFASEADMKYADRAARRLRNVTLKPFQRSDSESGREERIGISQAQVTTPSSPVRLSLAITAHTTLSDCDSACTASERSPSRRADETLEERTVRVLGPCAAGHPCTAQTYASRRPDFVSSMPNVNRVHAGVISNENDKKQLMVDVQVCLSAMDTARRAIDELKRLQGEILTDTDRRNQE